jgi:hypothetical protein
MARPRADVNIRFWSKVQIQDKEDCWNWIYKGTSQGYGEFWDNQTHSSIPSHRVAWMLTNGEIPKGFCVCHKCDNPKCCNPLHLFLGTQKENMKDMRAKGRGAKTYKRFLEKEVIEIKELHALGVSGRTLAKEFSTSPSRISKIVTGLVWKNVNG